MAKTLDHPRAAAILLKLLADDPSMVDFLNRDNLVDFIKLDLYDGRDLKLTAKGKKFVQTHLKQEDPDEGSWHGDFSRNPKTVLSTRSKRKYGINKHPSGLWGTSTPNGGGPFFKTKEQAEKWIELHKNDPKKADEYFYETHKNPRSRKKKNVSDAKFEQVISDYFEEI